MDTLQIMFVSLLFLSWLKHIIGFRFPWEVCECCGMKIRDHSKHEEAEVEESKINGFAEARKR